MKRENLIKIKNFLTTALMVIYDLVLFTAINYALCLMSSNNNDLALKQYNFVFSWQHIIITILFVALINYLLGLYRSIWTYAGTDEVIISLIASAINYVILFLVDTFIFKNLLHTQTNLEKYLYGIGIISFFVGMLVPRTLYRALRRYIISLTAYKSNQSAKRIMIVGAGYMGNFIIDDLRHSNYAYGIPVISVDDDYNKKSKRINGVRVAGTCKDIPQLVQKHHINEIIICIPSASKKRTKKIIDICIRTKCQVKISPSMTEFIENGRKEAKARKVEITDLLARPEIKLDKKVCKYLVGKTILVTGGGGSIGSELCVQVARYSPKVIVVFDIYENFAYELQTKLIRKYGNDINIQVRIGSVRDVSRLEEVFEEFKPDVVFHAAAHKHVPLMEDSPCEAVKNNVFGTYNVAKTADKFSVSKMVTLSTDKAVNPTNVMGATKRLCELIIQHMNELSTNTQYVAVRFGNVLGSHGSVIPLFKEQIENGGPVCVTHPDITRYFMTIPEAAQLVCQAGGLANGGEIFVLDMGEPVKIMDLAQRLIRLSGYTDDEIKIEIVGLRPGEKLFEELALEEELETRKKTANEKIYVTQPKSIDDEKFNNMLSSLKETNNKNVREKLMEFVKNYKPVEN